MHYTQCAVPCESSEPLPQPITSRKRAPVLVGAHLLYNYDGAVSPGGDAWRWLLWWLPGLLTQAVISSQHPQVQHHPPVATGMKETWSKKLEKLVGDSTEIAEEDAEVAQDADSGVWGDNKVLPHSVLGIQVQIPQHLSHWGKTCCVFLLIEEAARRDSVWI